MKVNIKGHKISGYYGPETGNGQWLFARPKPRARTYPIALVANGEVVEFEPEQQLSNFSNEEIAQALIAAA